MIALSPDVRVMLAPSEEYARLLADPPRGHGLAVRRPALVAVIAGTAAALAATGHLTAGLAASTVLCWSFAPLVQMGTAALVLRSRARRSLSLPQRLDLWFMGHTPWSLWLLGAAIFLASVPGSARVKVPVIVTAVVPFVWTTVIARAFCRAVLGDSPRTAVLRTLAHQMLTWSIALAYAGWAVALGPRIAAVLGR